MLSFNSMKKAVSEAVNDEKFLKLRENALKCQRKMEKTESWSFKFGAAVMGTGVLSYLVEVQDFGDPDLPFAILGIGGIGSAAYAITAGLICGAKETELKKSVQGMDSIIRKNYINNELREEYKRMGLKPEEIESKIKGLVPAEYEKRNSEFQMTIENYEDMNCKKFSYLDFVTDEDRQILIKQDQEFYKPSKVKEFFDNFSKHEQEASKEDAKAYMESNFGLDLEKLNASSEKEEFELDFGTEEDEFELDFGEADEVEFSEGQSEKDSSGMEC